MTFLFVHLFNFFIVLWRIFTGTACSTDYIRQGAIKGRHDGLDYRKCRKRLSLLLTRPTPDSRCPLETTAAGLLASVSLARVLWGTASPATAFSRCQHPTGERWAQPVELRGRRGAPTRSWGLSGETAAARRAELRRLLRRTLCSRPPRQPEPWRLLRRPT